MEEPSIEISKNPNKAIKGLEFLKRRGFKIPIGAEEKILYVATLAKEFEIPSKLEF